MSNVAWLFLGFAIAVSLTVALVKMFAVDRISHLMEARRAGSRIVSTGDFVSGRETIPVSLALTDSTFYYESADLAASLDVTWINEVEYDNELSTGRSIAAGKVMRLRCFSQMFEFIVRDESVPGWQAVMPAHRVAP